MVLSKIATKKSGDKEKTDTQQDVEVGRRSQQDIEVGRRSQSRELLRDEGSSRRR